MEYWDKIIVLHMESPRYRKLSIMDSKSAARMLLGRWPLSEGRSYRRAILNCSAALRGQGPSDVAQWSFVVAAMEAAIPYEIVDRLDAEIALVCKELLENEEALECPPSSNDKDQDRTGGKAKDGAVQPFWWSRPPPPTNRSTR